MVAYSFQKRFVPPIQSGVKIGTIRADRKRHARPGEPLQLYQGMRTRYCRKILEDPICTNVEPIQLTLTARQITMIEIGGPRWLLHRYGYDRFAQFDGFQDIADMHAFWLKTHGPGRFDGFWVLWRDWSQAGLREYLQ